MNAQVQSVGAVSHKNNIYRTVGCPQLPSKVDGRSEIRRGGHVWWARCRFLSVVEVCCLRMSLVGFCFWLPLAAFRYYRLPMVTFDRHWLSTTPETKHIRRRQFLPLDGRGQGKFLDGCDLTVKAEETK